MKVSVEDIKKTAGKKLEISFFDYIEEIELKDRVLANLTASVNNFDVNVSGEIKADLLLQCDRCLESYAHQVDVEINENFVSENVVPANQKDYELGKNEFVEELNGTGEVNIKNLIYQSIILNLPNKKLCKDDCPGLQQVKFNEGEEIIDERLEVFKRFSENKLDEN